MRARRTINSEFSSLRRAAGWITVAAVLLSAVLCAGRAAADLPVVEPPAEPKEQPDPLPLPRPDTNAPGGAPRNTGSQGDGSDRAGPKDEPVDLDILMKHVTDTRRPIALLWRDRLRDVADFGKLSFEQQSKAAPELLALLKNRTPLRYRVVLPDVPPMELRHRAQAALAQMLSVSLGDFETPADGTAGDEAAGDLAARWAALWAKMADLDEAARREVISSVRNEMIGTEDLAVAEANLRFALAEHDVLALPVLRKRLDEIPSQDGKGQGFSQLVVSVFGDLCGREGAPPESPMALLDLVRRLNTPDSANADHVLYIAGRVLQRVTGVTMRMERVEAGGDENGRQQVNLITKDCIEAWVKALQEREEKAANEKTGDAEAAPPADQ